jgi:hypothetical protein
LVLFSILLIGSFTRPIVVDSSSHQGEAARFLGLRGEEEARSGR